MAEQVIWEREIDHDKIKRRRDRYLQRFVPAAMAVLLVVLIFAGWKNAIGALIVVVGVGLLWGNVVRYQGMSDQANPRMTVDGEKLTLGRRSVMITDVSRFTTVADSIQTSLLGKYSRVNVGKAVFRVDQPGSKGDPELIEFGWLNMQEDGVATVKAALEPLFDDRWVEPSDLIDANELPEAANRGRRRRHQR